MKKFLIFCFVVFILSIFSTTVKAEVVLKWEQPGRRNVVGYNLYWGTISHQYDNKVDVGNVTEYPIRLLNLDPNTEYFFAITAYNPAGESDFSSEVSYTTVNIPKTPASLQLIVISNKKRVSQ